jgi:hypothetical protein
MVKIKLKSHWHLILRKWDYVLRWDLCRGLSVKVSRDKNRACGLEIPRRSKCNTILSKLWVWDHDGRANDSASFASSYIKKIRLLADINVFVQQCWSTTKRQWSVVLCSADGWSMLLHTCVCRTCPYASSLEKFVTIRSLNHNVLDLDENYTFRNLIFLKYMMSREVNFVSIIWASRWFQM